MKGRRFECRRCHAWRDLRYSTPVQPVGFAKSSISYWSRSLDHSLGMPSIKRSTSTTSPLTPREKRRPLRRSALGISFSSASRPRREVALGIWVSSCGYPTCFQGMDVDSNHSQPLCRRTMTAHPSRSADGDHGKAISAKRMVFSASVTARTHPWKLKQ